MLQLGSPGEDQLDLMSGKVTGIPAEFKYHPFRHIDWKEEARIKKQNACKSAVRTTEVGQKIYMDFGSCARRLKTTMALGIRDPGL